LHLPDTDGQAKNPFFFDATGNKSSFSYQYQTLRALDADGLHRLSFVLLQYQVTIIIKLWRVNCLFVFEK